MMLIDSCENNNVDVVGSMVENDKGRFRAVCVRSSSTVLHSRFCEYWILALGNVADGSNSLGHDIYIKIIARLSSQK